MHFCLMKSPYITVYFCHFRQAQTRKLNGEFCFNFRSFRRCMIATNYIDFRIPSSFRHRGAISLTRNNLDSSFRRHSPLICPYWSTRNEDKTTISKLKWRGFALKNGSGLVDRLWHAWRTEKDAYRRGKNRDRNRVPSCRLYGLMCVSARQENYWKIDGKSESIRITSLRGWCSSN